MKNKVLVILGQTATGKSSLAVKLARKHNGEVISADSRQVYKDLNLGTGKITKKEMKGIKHHMLDVANPKTKYNVARYQKEAFRIIEDILKRGKLPIICGGTGFYIDSLVRNIALPEVNPNMKLRKSLEKFSNEKLLKLLSKLDPQRAKSIDVHNKVRLIRAIEIAKAIGKVPRIKKNDSKYKFIQIGLYLPKEELQKKIKSRLMLRMKQGMLKEAQKLRKQGLSFKRMKELGLEYRYMALYLEKKMSKEEMLDKLNTEIYHYAKRQLTWFKRDQNIKWFKGGSKVTF